MTTLQYCIPTPDHAHVYLKRRAPVSIEPSAAELPLDFDPLGQLITVKKEDAVYFQRIFPSSN